MKRVEKSWMSRSKVNQSLSPNVSLLVAIYVRRGNSWTLSSLSSANKEKKEKIKFARQDPAGSTAK